MTAMSLEEKNKALRVLAEGCRRHPAYRARRRPGVDGCAACDDMYDAARKLAALESTNQSAKADSPA